MATANNFQFTDASCVNSSGKTIMILDGIYPVLPDGDYVYIDILKSHHLSNTEFNRLKSEKKAVPV